MMASWLKICDANCVPIHCTRMYPIALICLFPFSGECVAWLPHVLESSCRPPVAIGESQEEQILLIGGEADSCFGLPRVVSHRIETFFAAVGLQGGLWANQPLPRVTTQWGGAVFPVSDKRIEWVGVPVDHNESELMTNLYTEADLGEGCLPVGR